MAMEEDLVAAARALVPWHLAVDITPDLNTRAFADAAYPESFGRVRIIDPAERFKATLRKVFPEGLAGRTVLDCACNCGGYLFWARDLGAGDCLGVDVREHWIRQAEFLHEHRPDSRGMRFQTLDLYDLPGLPLNPFDVTFFNGIFYHLPDPISALQIVAALTREVLVLQTSTTINVPDGFLRVSEESQTRAVSGVHGLNWFPAGPAVIGRILAWAGFEEMRSSWWERSPGQVEGHGRLEMVAARSAAALERFDDADAAVPDLQRAVEHHVPPEATVAILSGRPGETFAFTGRKGIAFPTGPIPQGGSAEDLIDELAKLRDAGASYLVIREDDLEWMSGYPGFRKLLREQIRASLLPSPGRTELYSLTSLA